MFSWIKGSAHTPLLTNKTISRMMYLMLMHWWILQKVSKMKRRAFSIKSSRQATKKKSFTRTWRERDHTIVSITHKRFKNRKVKIKRPNVPLLVRIVLVQYIFPVFAYICEEIVVSRQACCYNFKPYWCFSGMISVRYVTAPCGKHTTCWKPFPVVWLSASSSWFAQPYIKKPWSTPLPHTARVECL